MSILIRVKEDLQALIDKRAAHFKDKERERSNRAAAMADRGPQRPLCPFRHESLAYSGPPHDVVRRYVCVHCSADATEGAIKDMGYEFDTVPDWIIHDLMDERLRQWLKGDPRHFPMGGGNGR